MSQCCATGEFITDYLTGRTLADSDDEQIRQSMERLLVEIKGFRTGEIEVDRMFQVEVDGRAFQGRAELIVRLGGRPLMAVKNTRGSLVTREQEATALARLVLAPRQIPLTVVFNGRDAELLDSCSAASCKPAWMVFQPESKPKSCCRIWKTSR